MIYVTLEKTKGGRHVVGCPHILNIQRIDFDEMPDGSAIYRVTGMGSGTVYFQPSKRSIVMWCSFCYENLAFERRQMAKHAEWLRETAKDLS